jgi:hypothetical protein
MKKKTLSFLLLALAAMPSLAQQGWLYSLSNVPDAIKAKADLITHLHNTTYEIEDLNNARENVHMIYTVPNAYGKSHLNFDFYSNKNRSLDDAEIKVFDATGRQIKRYKKKDMATVAMGEGLIPDGYVTYLQIPPSTYPVTIEVEYSVKYRGTLTVPNFNIMGEKESVIESNYTAIIPHFLPFRYKPANTTVLPVITENGNYRVYKWSVKNLSPIEYEEGSPSGYEKYPHVKMICEKFSYYGVPGDFTSWKSYGAWMQKLYDGLDVLPAERANFFVSMVKGAPDNNEKIRRIYSYLQQNFRYVSIQLGIGGFQPFSAEFTDKKKYGDCKALSNFMKAALTAVGVRSHIAIVRSQVDGAPLDPTFPDDPFNHVILCVPGAKDSIWLECTSSTNEFGELGTSTENRYALLLTENGGALVPTPTSQSSANRQETLSVINLADDLSGEIETRFRTTGYYRSLMGEIFQAKRDDQKRILVHYLGVKQPDDFVLLKNDSSSNHEMKLKLLVEKLPDFTAGNKLFISPRIYRLAPGTLPKYEKRKLDFYFITPFEKTDTTIFKLQEGSKPDVLLKDKELNCAYASYKTKSWYDEKENAVYSVVNLVLKKHQIPAAAYAEVKTFFDNVQQNDGQKLVILKGDSPKKAF